MSLTNTPQELPEGKEPETELQRRVRAALEAHAKDPRAVNTKGAPRGDNRRSYTDLGPTDDVAKIMTIAHTAASLHKECDDTGTPAEDRTPTSFQKHKGGPFSF
ncbi:MAG: hypothetical protein WC843_05230 [Candidatus Gracilibacteria bacterium]|jgi:hypothetical protein